MGVTLNLTPNIVYKCSKFSEAFPKKCLKLVLSGRNGHVTFDLGLILLSVKVNPILEKQSCKKDAFITLGPISFEMVLALSTKVVTFNV